MIAAAHIAAAAAFTRGPVAESVTQRSAIVSFRTSSRDLGHLHAYARNRPHDGVVYVAVGTGGTRLSYDANKLTIPSARVIEGRCGALRVDVADRAARFRYETVDGKVRGRFRVTCS